MAENTKKPAIRFAGFTEAWEQRKLGELILEYKETVDSNCILPVLTSSKTEGVILQEEHFGRKQQHDIAGYNMLPRNYCTYRNRSDGVDFTFNVNNYCDMGIISKFYPVFCGNDNDTHFLSLVLNNSDEVVHEIAYTCTGTGQKVLSFIDLQKMSIRVPRHSEQQKISVYFKKLDNLITLHQRKYDQLTNVKKSMLEKMFPKNGSNVPEIRFKGFTEAWEQRKLGEVVGTYDGVHQTPKYQDNGIMFLSVENIATLQSSKYISEDDFKRDYKVYPQENDILMTRIGDVGTTNVITDNGLKAYYVSLALLKYKSTNPYFLSNAIQSDYVKKGLANRTLKTAIPMKINKEEIGKVDVMLPTSVKEQTKIGEYFRNLDNLITLHQRKLEKLKNIKKSMLEKMFI